MEHAAIPVFLKQIVRDAGAAILSASITSGTVMKDGSNNFVTAADMASERIIVERIRQSFPSHAILSEESFAEMADPLTQENLWIIDPLDGTTNFKNDRRYVGVSVGYAQNGLLKAGAVFNFFHDELFFAEEGKGATLNGNPIHVTTKQDIAGASIASDNCYDPVGTKAILDMYTLLHPTPWVLMRGCASLALCDVACGRTDAFFHTSMKPWDNAGGFLIIQEAGGVAKDFQGKDASFVTPAYVAGNATLVDRCVTAFSK